MKICIFCSARTEFPQNALETFRDLSFWMAEQEHSLVYGGGSVGVMGLVANSFLDKEADVIGVIPRSLFEKEVVHLGLTELIETEDLMARKRKMMELSDMFVCLPGGVGTLDEALEVLTWKTLKCWDKPILFFNHDGFWDKFIDLIHDLKEKKVLGDEVTDAYEICNSVDELKQRIEAACNE